LTPLLLGVFLPEAVPKIVDIIRRSRYSSQNLGDWCTFGCLDPTRDGTGYYSTPRCRPDAEQQRPDGLVSREGKLEKSVLSFVLTHRLAWPRSASPSYEQVPHTASSNTPFRLPPAAVSSPHSGGQSYQSHLGYRALTSAPQRRSGASAREVTIPMQEMGRGNIVSSDEEESSSQQRASQQDGGDLLGLGASSPRPATVGSDRSPPPLPHQASNPEDAERRASSQGQVPPPPSSTACWGYPPSALNLLEDLEEFQEQEVAPESAHFAFYSSLPEELVRLQRVVPTSGQGPTELGLWSPEGEVEQGSCSPHFFWLEALYDYQSGRLEGGGGDSIQLPSDNSLLAECAVL